MLLVIRTVVKVHVPQALSLKSPVVYLQVLYFRRVNCPYTCTQYETVCLCNEHSASSMWQELTFRMLFGLNRALPNEVDFGLVI